MKLLIMIALNLVAVSAFAGRNLTCVDRNIQDASITANFSDIGTENAKVDLFVPSGETAGQTYTGACTSVPNSIETSVICNVVTSTDSGYEVDLYSSGGAELTASVTPQSLKGAGISTTLPCEDKSNEPTATAR